MKIDIKKFVLVILIVTGTSISTFAEDERDFGAYVKKELDASPKFDRAKAESEACDELKIKTPPAVPKNKSDFDGEASEKVKQMTDEKFPESLKIKIYKEGDDKFKAVRVGEQVTVPYRSGG
ncbi:MAG: hypothetical protein NT118_09310, partial [Lentisphaerae bacterium]|nr:hypothetical protein [Lentisphaerota bacterium]